MNRRDFICGAALASVSCGAGTTSLAGCKARGDGFREPERDLAVDAESDLVVAGGGPWEDFRVAYSAEALAQRDARRIHGRYTVTVDDVAAGSTFPDAVTTSRFGIDVHPQDADENRKFAGGHDLGRTFRPFQIPLRACRAKDADNLYMAGRNISGDFIAHASYRVTGSAVALGEGVGRVLANS